MSKALEVLPVGWAVVKTEDGWRVGPVSDDCYECGASFSQYAEGDRLLAMVKRAISRFELEEREIEERRQDYEARKAAGQLTEMELSGERIAAYFRKRALEDAMRPSVLLDLFKNKPVTVELKA